MGPARDDAALAVTAAAAILPPVGAAHAWSKAQRDRSAVAVAVAVAVAAFLVLRRRRQSMYFATRSIHASPAIMSDSCCSAYRSSFIIFSGVRLARGSEFDLEYNI